MSAWNGYPVLSEAPRSLDVSDLLDKALPVGTIHTWSDGKRHRKDADGWSEVRTGSTQAAFDFSAKPKLAEVPAPAPTKHGEVVEHTLQRIVGVLRAEHFPVAKHQPKRGIRISGFEAKKVIGARGFFVEWMDWANHGDRASKLQEVKRSLEAHGYVAEETAPGSGMLHVRPQAEWASAIRAKPPEPVLHIAAAPAMETKSKAPVPGSVPAAKLRKVAASVREKAEEKANQDRKTNTAKRAREAGHAVRSAWAELAHADTMDRIADAHEAGTLQHLRRVTSKTQVEELYSQLNRGRGERHRVMNVPYGSQEYQEPPSAQDAPYAKYPWPDIHKDNLRYLVRDLLAKPPVRSDVREAAQRLVNAAVGLGEHEWLVKLDTPERRADGMLLMAAAKKAGVSASADLEDSFKRFRRVHDDLGITNEADLREALAEYANYREKPKQETKLQKLQRDLVGAKIPGYFPTPKPIVDGMLAEADVRPGMTVLEPSAGQGHIADAVKEAGGEVTTLEFNHSLRGILEEKGHVVAGNDALTHGGLYDRVLMNPPFEHGQDVEHVRHAFENNLKPGGRLVAIMSEHPFFADDKTSRDFREWLDGVGGTSEKLPEGSFKTSEVPTGVNTRMVVIQKAG